MHRSPEERAKDRREAREADPGRHREAMDEGLLRHEEAMTALRVLITRSPAVGDGSSAA